MKLSISIVIGGCAAGVFITLFTLAPAVRTAQRLTRPRVAAPIPQQVATAEEMAEWDALAAEKRPPSLEFHRIPSNPNPAALAGARAAQQPKSFLRWLRNAP